MFWIGMIVGGIIGIAMTLWYCISLAVKECGSIDKAAEVGDLITKANENRESEIYAYRCDDDKCLGCVIFEELE